MTEPDEVDFRPFLEFLPFIIEDLNPSDYRTALDRDRPYNGQPHTDLGERGKTELKGITFRDVRDCFVIAAFLASPQGYPEERRGSIYDLDLNDIDPIAWSQNLACELERRMGIFPNVPELRHDDD